jgi:hypothetical protein
MSSLRETQYRVPPAQQEADINQRAFADALKAKTAKLALSWRPRRRRKARLAAEKGNQSFADKLVTATRKRRRSANLAS